MIRFAIGNRVNIPTAVIAFKIPFCRHAMLPENESLVVKTLSLLLEVRYGG